MTPEAMLQALNWRYAVKKFDPDRKIPNEQWHVLEESLRLTPSSFGLQLWRFIVIDDAATRAAIKPHAWDQQQVTTCSKLVAFTHKTDPSEADVDRHINYVAQIRNVSKESLAPYRERIIDFTDELRQSNGLASWTSQQTYLALGFFMSAAAALHIDTCPMEGFEHGPVDRVLGLEGSGYRTAVLCAAGYRAQDDAFQTLPKVRFPRSMVIDNR